VLQSFIYHLLYDLFEFITLIRYHSMRSKSSACNFTRTVTSQIVAIRPADLEANRTAGLSRVGRILNLPGSPGLGHRVRAGLGLAPANMYRHPLRPLPGHTILYDLKMAGHD